MSFFFLHTVQPLHTQTGYYSIFTVWLQCPLLLLRRCCRLEFVFFCRIFFYQYQLEYSFKASPSSMWYTGVGVGLQPKMCSDDLCICVRSDLEDPAALSLISLCHGVGRRSGGNKVLLVELTV